MKKLESTAALLIFCRAKVLTNHENEEDEFTQAVQPFGFLCIS